jgi:primosomal replication protein N
VAGNRIELDGRVLSTPEFRVSPSGTPFLRLLVECGQPGDELNLSVLLTGSAATAIKALLEPGRPVKVVGSLRARRGGAVAQRSETMLEVVATSVEPADS